MVLTEADLTGNRARDHRTRARWAASAGATPSTSSRCSPATTSCTPSTASAASSRCGSARSAAPPASTWCWSTRRRKRGQPADRLFVPTDALDEVSRYVGGEVPTLNKLGGADWAKTKGRARKAVRQIAAQLVQLYAARQSAPGHAFAPGHALAARARGRLPVHRDAGPARGDRRGQGGHGAAGPDGPGDLRRRRVRQDRDRGARGVQGGAGRQAGRGAGADDAAGHPAPADVLRPDARLPGHRQGPVAVHRRRRGRSRRSRAWPTAPSTSSSAPTGCCRPASAGRTSAW